MDKSGNSHEPMASGAAGSVGHRSCGEHGREIRHDAEALATAVQSAADDLNRYVTEQVQSRPYRTLAMAAAVGFVVGGGLRSPLTPALLGVAARLAVSVAARELADRLMPDAPVAVETQNA
jgi:hypothetical protein